MIRFRVKDQGPPVLHFSVCKTSWPLLFGSSTFCIPQRATPHHTTPHYRGWGVSWHFNFVREISRFKLTAEFPARNSGFSANFSHTSGTHCGLWRVVIHSTRGLCEISHSEIYHRQFDLA